MGFGANLGTRAVVVVLVLCGLYMPNGRVVCTCLQGQCNPKPPIHLDVGWPHIALPDPGHWYRG